MTVIGPNDRPFASLAGRRSADPLGGMATEVSVRRVRLEHSPTRTAHRHPHSEEIVYVASGRGHVWIDGAPHPVQAGDIIHIPRGALHATIPAPEVAMELVCFFPHPDLASNIEETDVGVGSPLDVPHESETSTRKEDL